MRRRKTRQHLAISATVLACAMALACGGGGGISEDGGMMGNGVVATFLGDPGGDVGMAAGVASGSDFEVQILVDDIDKLFGAAFHLSFDNTSASFLNVSGASSILGATADFQAALVGVNELAVSGSMTGTGAGIDNATGLLLTLLFRATAETSENRFTFEPTGSRLVKICPMANETCTEIVPASWTGGTMLASK